MAGAFELDAGWTASADAGTSLAPADGCVSGAPSELALSSDFGVKDNERVNAQRKVMSQQVNGSKVLLHVPTGSGPMWQQVAAERSLEGMGDGFAFTRDLFEEIVTNFRKNPAYDGGTAPVVPWDVAHASEVPRHLSSLEGAKAVGWISELEIREGPEGSELWALTSWLPAAADAIREGAFRWASVAIISEATDVETGEPIGALLSSVAVTNNPAVRGMQPLAASASPAASPTFNIWNEESILSDDSLDDDVKRGLLVQRQLLLEQAAKAFPHTRFGGQVMLNEARSGQREKPEYLDRLNRESGFYEEGGYQFDAKSQVASLSAVKRITPPVAVAAAATQPPRRHVQAGDKLRPNPALDQAMGFVATANGEVVLADEAPGGASFDSESQRMTFRLPGNSHGRR